MRADVKARDEAGGFSLWWNDMRKSTRWGEVERCVVREVVRDGGRE